MSPKVKDTLFKNSSRLHTALYRRTGGKRGGRVKGAPVLLLTTTGRRTGRAHTSPALYLEDAGRKVIVPAYGGDDRSPAWYLNLTAHPEVTVQVGSTMERMRAEVANPDERAALWPRLSAMYPGYDAYQKKTTRQFPVVILTPA